MNKEQFFKRNKGVINRLIRTRLGKTGRIVHGSRAQNALMPRFLSRHATDWDILARNPKKAAEGLEKVLDKKFRGDFFRVREGKTRRLKVHKVVSNITDEGVADFATAERRVPSITKRRIRFATLKDQKERAEKNLKTKSAIYRRKKDLDLLERIRIFEKQRGKKV